MPPCSCWWVQTFGNLAESRHRQHQARLGRLNGCILSVSVAPIGAGCLQLASLVELPAGQCRMQSCAAQLLVGAVSLGTAPVAIWCTCVRSSCCARQSLGFSEFGLLKCAMFSCMKRGCHQCMKPRCGVPDANCCKHQSPTPCLFLLCQITNLDYDEHKGRISIGRISSGAINRAQQVAYLKPGEISMW